MKTIADIPESFIDGVEDLGNGNGIVAEDKYTYLQIINNKDELNNFKLKYFFGSEDKKNMFDNIDLSKNTILFAYQMVCASQNLSYITIKKIKYDVKKHIYCVLYKYSGSDHHGDLSLGGQTGMYHAYTIPKTQTKDITYDLIELKNLDPNYGNVK